MVAKLGHERAGGCAIFPEASTIARHLLNKNILLENLDVDSQIRWLSKERDAAFSAQNVMPTACTRAATFGASPNTSPAASATTEPHSMPMRAERLGRAGRGVARVEVGERALDRQRREHGALGVALLRLGIAEQRHQPVAELLQHVAAERSHGGRGGVEVTPHRIAPVVRIELRGEARRAREVAKHDRDRTARSRVLLRLGQDGCDRRFLGADLRRTEARDRLEQALAVTKQYPNLTEIVFRQVGQNIHADGVISKLRLVLAEIEASQPIPDVDDRSSIGCRRS